MARTILEQLPDCSWRGIKFPVEGERAFGFGHDQTKHRYIFKDTQLIESLGRQNPTYRYKIPFRESIQQYGWKELFTSVYPRFLEACLDRSAGELVDLVHGPVRAKLASLQEVLSIGKKDGVDVSADFIFAPKDDRDVASDFVRFASTLEGVKAGALVYGENVRGLSEENQKLFEELNPGAQKAKVSILKAGRVAASSVQQTKNKTRAELDSFSQELESTNAALEQAQDPQLEEFRRSNVRLMYAAKDTNETISRPPGPYSVARTNAEMGRVALATHYQITVDALLAFNPWMADLMRIPSRSQIRLPSDE